MIYNRKTRRTKVGNGVTIEQLLLEVESVLPEIKRRGSLINHKKNLIDCVKAAKDVEDMDKKINVYLDYCEKLSKADFLAMHKQLVSGRKSSKPVEVI